MSAGKTGTKIAAIIIIIIIIAAAAGWWYTTTRPPAKKAKIAVLFDVGGRGDLSFNDMAWLGAEKAMEDFKVDVTYLTPPTLADMKPLLEEYAGSGEYSLLVLIGFLWTTPLNETADKYPDQKFALIDATTGVVRPNEVDILFREQECACLMGIAAAGMAHALGGDTVAACAGMDIPPLWKFHIGYLFGVKYYDLKMGTTTNFLWTYTGTFTDPSIGKEYTRGLLEQGAKVVYGLAGLTHLGAFEAVKEWHKTTGELVFAMGQDASQEWIDPEHIPISGAKRVDVAVYTAIKMVVKGPWEGGIITLGLKEEGVGIWDIDGVKWFAEQASSAGRLAPELTPDKVADTVSQLRETYITPEVWDLIHDLEDDIKAGRIVFKTPMTHDEYESIISALMAAQSLEDLNVALEKGSVS